MNTKTLLAAVLAALAIGARAAEARITKKAPSPSPYFVDSEPGKGYSPVMVGFFTPAQVPNADYDIGGLRINFPYTTCHNFSGLDLGLVGHMTARSTGVLLSFVTYGERGGIGFAMGGASVFGGDFSGMQVGLLNMIDCGRVFQLGFLNHAQDAKGFQLGVVNTAAQFEGVQVGLANVISESSQPFLPIVNWYF